MRSFILLGLVALTLTQCASAAQIVSATFWNDSSCSTAPLSISTVYGLTETPAWQQLPLSAVYDADPAPCVNVSLTSQHGNIASGQYSCESNLTASGGLLIEEWTTPGCQGSPSVIYEFLGAPNSTCNSGFIQVFPAGGGAPTMYNIWASAVCNNVSFIASSSSSSSSSTGTAGGNGTTTGGNGASAAGVSGWVVAVVLAVASVVSLLA